MHMESCPHRENRPLDLQPDSSHLPIRYTCPAFPRDNTGLSLCPWAAWGGRTHSNWATASRSEGHLPKSSAWWHFTHPSRLCLSFLILQPQLNKSLSLFSTIWVIHTVYIKMTFYLESQNHLLPRITGYANTWSKPGAVHLSIVGTVSTGKLHGKGTSFTLFQPIVLQEC